MRLVGSGGQVRLDELYDASGTLNNQSVLALGQSQSRSHLLIQNTGSATIWVMVGPAKATATLGSGVVSSVAVANAGQNYSFAPKVIFLGGGGAIGGVPAGYVGLGQEGAPSPSRVAQAHCVMTGSAGAMTISSIVVDDPGAGYVAAPYVYLQNDPRDPNGVAIAAANTGIRLDASTSPVIWNGTVCPTSAISIFAAAPASYTLLWMP